MEGVQFLLTDTEKVIPIPACVVRREIAEKVFVVSTKMSP